MKKESNQSSNFESDSIDTEYARGMAQGFIKAGVTPDSYAEGDHTGRDVMITHLHQYGSPEAIEAFEEEWGVKKSS